MIRPVRYALLATLPVAALLVPAGPASADPPVVDLNCVTTVTTTLHPNVDLEFKTFTVNSNGLTGTADCTGTIDGATVTGPGQFAVNEVVTGNCFGATGSGTFVLQVPTTEGIKTVTGQFDLVASPTTGTVHTGDLTGTSTVVAAHGDCVNTPITEATAVLIDHVT